MLMPTARIAQPRSRLKLRSGMVCGFRPVKSVMLTSIKKLNRILAAICRNECDAKRVNDESQDKEKVAFDQC